MLLVVLMRYPYYALNQSCQFYKLLILVVHEISVLEDAFKSLLESVDVIVDQVLLVNLRLIYQAHQRQVVVNLSQV